MRKPSARSAVQSRRRRPGSSDRRRTVPEGEADSGAGHYDASLATNPSAALRQALGIHGVDKHLANFRPNIDVAVKDAHRLLRV